MVIRGGVCVNGWCVWCVRGWWDVWDGEKVRWVLSGDGGGVVLERGGGVVAVVAVVAVVVRGWGREDGLERGLGRVEE